MKQILIRERRTENKKKARVESLRKDLLSLFTLGHQSVLGKERG